MSTPSRRGRPRSEDLSRRLIDSAASLFARQGVDRTSTRQVAAAAGTTERTLFQRFGSKDGLLSAVVDRALLAHSVPDSLASLGEDIRSFDGDLEAWHRRLLQSRALAWREAGDLLRVLGAEMLRHPGLFERFVAEWRAEAWDPLVTLFSSLQGAGRLRGDIAVTELVRHFLSVNLSFLMEQALAADDRGALAEDAEDEARIAVIASLFAAAATGGRLP